MNKLELKEKRKQDQINAREKRKQEKYEVDGLLLKEKHDFFWACYFHIVEKWPMIEKTDAFEQARKAYFRKYKIPFDDE